MIFYYTSTGNSLFIAKQLDDKKLMSIPQVLKGEQFEFEDDTIGIIYPDYAAEMPRSVKKFLEKVTLKANYIYMIATYGKLHSVVCVYGKKYAEDHSIHVNYANALLMVDNWLPSFDMLDEIAIDKHIPEQLASIKKDLSERKEYVLESDQVGIDAYHHVQKRNQEQPEYSNGTALKCNTDKCIGCGICTKVCPVGRNILVDGKRSERMNMCDFCLGCVHACPQNAFYLSIPEKNNNARYRNPNINIKEIMESNQQ